MQSVEWYREKAGISASLSAEDRQIISNDWQTLTGETFTESFNPNCPNRYRDALILIVNKMAKQENTNASGYELKRGVAFRFKGKIYTWQNITAEAAEAYIREDLEHRDDFETLARDYDSYAEEAAMRATEKIE